MIGRFSLRIFSGRGNGKDLLPGRIGNSDEREFSDVCGGHRSDDQGAGRCWRLQAEMSAAKVSHEGDSGKLADLIPAVRRQAERVRRERDRLALLASAGGFTVTGALGCRGPGRDFRKARR